MKLIVPKRRDLYRMLVFVIIALMVVFYFTPKMSSAADRATQPVAQNQKSVSGVSGAAAPGTGSSQGSQPVVQPTGSAGTVSGASQSVNGAASTLMPDQSGLQVPQGFQPQPYMTPASNTPPPTTPGENP